MHPSSDRILAHLVAIKEGRILPGIRRYTPTFHRGMGSRNIANATLHALADAATDEIPAVVSRCVKQAHAIGHHLYVVGELRAYVHDDPVLLCAMLSWNVITEMLPKDRKDHLLHKRLVNYQCWMLMRIPPSYYPLCSSDWPYLEAWNNEITPPTWDITQRVNGKWLLNEATIRDYIGGDQYPCLDVHHHQVRNNLAYWGRRNPSARFLAAIMDERDIVANDAAMWFVAPTLVDDGYIKLATEVTLITRFLNIAQRLPLELRERLAIATTGHSQFIIYDDNGIIRWRLAFATHYRNVPVEGKKVRWRLAFNQAIPRALIDGACCELLA